MSEQGTVFLCHSSGDKPAVRKLYQRLKADGLNPWLDEEDILPGEDWKLTIERTLRSSAVVLVCLSKQSVNKNGYVQKEIKHALDCADERPEGEVFVIPVRLEECEIPQSLSKWQGANMFDERGYSRMLKTLAEKGLTPEPERWHSVYIRALAVTPDGKLVVSASTDNTLKVWDLASQKELLTLSGHSDVVTAVAVTPNSKQVISASWDRTLKVWDLASGQTLRTVGGHTSYVTAVSVTGDGKRAVSACWDNTLQVWEVATARALRTLRGHSRGVYAVAVTPDGKLVVSASSDKTLKVWDLDTGSELRTLTGHSDEVSAVAVTPDGKLAVSACWDDTLKVWELDSGRELRTLTGHWNDVNAVAITPDGKMAVSASGDQTLRVWELDTGELLDTHTANSALYCCAVAPNGIMIAGDAVGAIHYFSTYHAPAR